MVKRFYVTLITNRLRETDGVFQSIQIQHDDAQIERGEWLLLSARLGHQ
jgi:hypothetical protein